MLSRELLERLRDPFDPSAGMVPARFDRLDTGPELARAKAAQRAQRLRTIVAFANRAEVHRIEAGTGRPLRRRMVGARPKPLRHVTLSAMDATGSNHYLVGAA